MRGVPRGSVGLWGRGRGIECQQSMTTRSSVTGVQQHGVFPQRGVLTQRGGLAQRGGVSAQGRLLVQFKFSFI